MRVLGGLTEPHTPSPRRRLDAVAELRRRGIDSGILIAPLMPGINDTPRPGRADRRPRPRSRRQLPRRGGAASAGARFSDVFFAWLRAKRPDLVPEYERLYGKGRAYMCRKIAYGHPRPVKGWGTGQVESAARPELRAAFASPDAAR